MRASGAFFIEQLQRYNKAAGSQDSGVHEGSSNFQLHHAVATIVCSVSFAPFFLPRSVLRAVAPVALP